MAKKTNVTRKKADEQIQQGAVLNSSVDLLTLKRMYPKRFLADILDKEGYEQVAYGKFKKKKADEG